MSPTLRQFRLLAMTSALALAMVAVPAAIAPMSLGVLPSHAFAGELVSAKVTADASATIDDTTVDSQSQVTAMADGDGATATGGALGTALVKDEGELFAKATTESTATAIGNDSEPVAVMAKSMAGALADPGDGVAAGAGAEVTSTDPAYGSGKAEGKGIAAISGPDGDALAIAHALAEIPPAESDAGAAVGYSGKKSWPHSAATSPQVASNGGAGAVGTSHSLSGGMAIGDDHMRLALSLSASQTRLEDEDGDHALTRSWASANAIQAEQWSLAWAQAAGTLSTNGDAGGQAGAIGGASATPDGVSATTKAGTGAWLNGAQQSLGTSAGTQVALSSMNGQ